MLSLALLSVVVMSQDPGPGSLQPVALRCEHRTEPLDVDADRPVLGWQLAAAGARTRGLMQTAWQVRVGSDAAALAGGVADLWDSGKADGARTSDIEYGGAPLASRQRCWWQVRSWDQDGKAGAWSAPAMWAMGLLQPTDWQAQWIGYDAPLAAREAGPDFEGASWLWASEVAGQAAPPVLHFRGEWQLPAHWDAARLCVTGDDQFELWINGTAVGGSDGKPDAWRRPRRLDVDKALRPGRNVIAVRVQNHGGAGGLIAKLVLGGATPLVTTADWRTAAAAGEGWQQPQFDDASWQRAADAGKYGAAPWGRIDTAAMFLPPPRLLQKTFAVAAMPQRAMLYASALGLYEVELNGRKVGDAWFAPGWTDYDKRVYYQAYDVSSMLRQGDNELRVLLADGWHSGYVGYGHKRDHYGDKIRARVQLELDGADGAQQVVCTDASWRGGTGTTREADFLMGETCDMTFAPAEPQPVVVSESPALLQSHPGEPVRVIAELKPVSIKKTGDDTYVCNLGQNIAGFARLRLQGKRGQRITLRFAERLDADGNIYTANLRMARCTDTYVCAGSGVEVWQPRFTFHGFQYVEIQGLGRTPDQDTITGIAVSSDTPMTGDFTCSDAMVNKLVSNIRWTQRMNFIDIPTDCPQRDERLGWTGDAQAYIRTATCFADAQAFYDKWLIDLADAQRQDGQFPMVAPLKVAGSDGGPAWADAGVICPWNVYEVYGDRRLLQRQYPSMRRFVEFCRQRSTEQLRPPEKFHCFGDWLHIDDATPNEVIYSAYFAHSTHLVAKSAAVLGHADDAQRYDQLWQQLRRTFQQTYCEADGQIRGHSQTGYVMALAFDLLDEAHARLAAQHLIAHLQARHWHLATGFVGTKDLMLVLDEIGRNDVAWRLLGNKDFPSWGFEIENGATSIWERWNGWTPEHGFNDPGMNSFAHYAFGAVGQWLFEVAGGIRTDGPGFDRVVIAPQPGGDVTWAKTKYGSVHGDIETSWKYEGDRVLLDVTVPPNVTAVVKVPTDDPASVRMENEAPAKVAGVKVVAGGVYEVQSGTWAFAAKRR